MNELHAGDLIDGRYRIATTLAHGGMSTVYAAIDLRLDREVAIKVMAPEFAADSRFRKRFIREARAVARLSHPTLVNVFDQGTDAHNPQIVFLVMELVAGGSLRELLREYGALPLDAVVAIMHPVLTALSIAHRSRMIHRDIKPDNVLISNDHKVKLADFGLVRAIQPTPEHTPPSHAGHAGHTDQHNAQGHYGNHGHYGEQQHHSPTFEHTHTLHTGQVIGTAAYFSPEQVQGETLSYASDVYSAGILLFELLTGTTPFSGDTPLDIAYARLHHDVPPPSSRVDMVPEEFDDIVATACHRDPAQRYIDGAEFLEDLEEVTRGLNILPSTIPVPSHSAVNAALSNADFGQRHSWNDDALETGIFEEQPQGFYDPTEVIYPDETPEPADSTQVMSHYNTPEGYGEQGAYVEPGAYGVPEGYAEPGTELHPEYAAHNPGWSPEGGAGWAAEGYNNPEGYGNYPGDYPPANHAYNPQALPAPIAPQPPVPVASASPPVLSNISTLATVLWVILLVLLVALFSLGGWWLSSGHYGTLPTLIG